MGTRPGERDEVAEAGVGEHLAVARRAEVGDVAEGHPPPLVGSRVDGGGQPGRRVRVVRGEACRGVDRHHVEHHPVRRRGGRHGPRDRTRRPSPLPRRVVGAAGSRRSARRRAAPAPGSSSTPGGRPRRGRSRPCQRATTSLDVPRATCVRRPVAATVAAARAIWAGERTVTASGPSTGSIRAVRATTIGRHRRGVELGHLADPHLAVAEAVGLDGDGEVGLDRPVQPLPEDDAQPHPATVRSRPWRRSGSNARATSSSPPSTTPTRPSTPSTGGCTTTSASCSAR